MTKKLKELFDLADSDFNDTETDVYAESMHALTELDRQLPTSDITDLSTSDAEMDDLADKALTHYNDLMDLGMNVEPRFSAPIFEAATKLMGHAITAKTNKIDKKLKALDLEIKKRRLELQEKQAKLNDDDHNEGSAREIDRNALLELLRNKGSDTDAR
jgi:hypothetical protein